MAKARVEAEAGVETVEEGQWQAQVMHMDRVTWLNF